jgi:DNA polymerase III subunit alpha
MIHTHRHSTYSTLDGCGTNLQFAERAAELGQWALALTDHGNLNGALDFLKSCDRFGVHPILGIEAYYRPDRRVQKQVEWRYRRWHMILLAQDLVGWHNLIRLSSEAFRSGLYQDPCVDDELLDRYNEGIICTTSCILGPLAHLIENGTDAQVDAWIGPMAKRFKDRLFVEIQPHDFDRQRAMNLALHDRAQHWGLPEVAGVDAHYVWDGYADTQKIVALISTNTTVAKAAEKNRERIERGDEVYELGHEGLHLMSEQEVLDRFAEHHPDLSDSVVREAVDNTELIARMVQPFLLDRQLKMPQVAPSEDESERRVMAWCREGMDAFGRSGDPAYERQLEHEAEIMRARRNFSYIYLIGLVVRWARSSEPLPPTANDPQPTPKRPIRVGSSRGSAGASLVCFMSRITSIDPIAWKLKFERFMNPGRKGLPDIDVDFPDDRRSEVKEYVRRVCGRECVADVVAFSRFTPRAALKDVARILGVDGKRTKDVTDQIDQVHDENLTEMRGRMRDLDRYAREFPEVWCHAERLENHGDPFIKGVSKHAAGVIITPGHVNDSVPTIRADEDDPGQRTAWSETPWVSICDDYGVMKADFLSVAGMKQQDMILARIAERTGEEIDLDHLPVCSDPYDVEPDVMEKFCLGVTLGCNQFESPGIVAFLKSAKPQNVVDLAAMNALYRPGPMGAKGHEIYARRRSGREQAEIHPVLERVLADTFGVTCFHWSTMVSLADGREVMAKDIRNGDLVHTLDQATRKIVVRRCRGCAPTRRVDGLRISLSNGESVVLTNDHQILRNDGMIPANQISVGDLIAVARHTRTVGVRSFGIAPWLGDDDDVSYLLGQLTGDGCTSGVGVSLCTGVETAHKKVLGRLKLSLPRLKMHPYWNVRSWYIGISCPDLAGCSGNRSRKTKFHCLLEDLGMKTVAPVKRIPEIVRTGTKEVRRAFMAGLFDADGTLKVISGKATRCSITSTSIGLLRDIAAFLRSEGIPYTFYENKVMMWDISTFLDILSPWLVVKAHQGDAYSGETVGFVTKDEVRGAWIASGKTQQEFCDSVGLSRSTISQARPGRPCDSRTGRRAGVELGDILFHAVVSIDEVLDQQFYGMSVEDHHNFVGNGVILKNCFQEQIMELFEVLVGYSSAQADDIRKEIDKLNRGKSDQGRVRLAARKDEFIEKASAHIGEDSARVMWAEILPYTGYSFNRPHASGYTLASYQDMWLKVHYPLDFYAVLMTIESEKAPRAIKEAWYFDVEVAAPDVNKSGMGFSVDYDDRALRFGLSAIDGIGDIAATQVVANAPYDSIEHFEMANSVKYSKCNAGHRKALYECGALDSLGARAQFSEAEKALMETRRLKIAFRPGGTFGEDEEMISRSAHSQVEYEELPVDAAVVLAGIVEEVKVVKTKRGRNPGQEMAMLTVRFGLDTFRVTAFPGPYARHKHLLQKGNGLMINGSKNDRDEVTMYDCMGVNEFVAAQHAKTNGGVAA